MKSKFLFCVLSLLALTVRAETFDATNASWDRLIFAATRYGSTEEKREQKEQAHKVIFDRGPDSLHFLMAQIQVENIMVSVLTQELVEHLNAKQAVPVLLDFLETDDPTTRKMAAYFLSFYKTPKHAKKLLPLLDDEKTRGSAMRTLGKWRIKSACPTIGGYLNDPKERIRIVAVNALRDIGYSAYIPPLINAYMNLSPTMRVFDTVSNPDFGGVEETGILLTIPDIYPEKKQRYMRWQGWRENLKQRREHFRLRLQEHLSRIGKKREV